MYVVLVKITKLKGPNTMYCDIICNDPFFARKRRRVSVRCSMVKFVIIKQWIIVIRPSLIMVTRVHVKFNLYGLLSRIEQNNWSLEWSFQSIFFLKKKINFFYYYRIIFEIKIYYSETIGRIWVTRLNVRK